MSGLHQEASRMNLLVDRSNKNSPTRETYLNLPRESRIFLHDLLRLGFQRYNYGEISLGKALGISRASVQRHLLPLKKTGFIHVTRHRREPALLEIHPSARAIVEMAIRPLENAPVQGELIAAASANISFNKEKQDLDLIGIGTRYYESASPEEQSRINRLVEAGGDIPQLLGIPQKVHDGVVALIERKRSHFQTRQAMLRRITGVKFI